MKWAEEFLNSYCSDIKNSTQLTHEKDVSCLLFPNIAVSYQTKTSWVFSVSYLVGRELSRRTPERLLKKPMDQNTRESCMSILNVYLIICPSEALKILTARGPMAVGTGNHCWRTLILHGGDMAPRGAKTGSWRRGGGDKKSEILQWFVAFHRAMVREQIHSVSVVLNCYREGGGVIREKKFIYRKVPAVGMGGVIMEHSWETVLKQLL